jgi:hypothetical protein
MDLRPFGNHEILCHRERSGRPRPERADNCHGPAAQATAKKPEQIE